MNKENARRGSWRAFLQEAGLDFGEGLVQVGEDVVDVFRADRQAYCALVDALVFQFGFRKLGMRRCGGVDDQRLDVGYVGQQREDLQGVDEPEGFLLAALDLEGEDGAAAVREVLQVGRVVRVVRQGGASSTSTTRTKPDVVCGGHTPSP